MLELPALADLSREGYANTRHAFPAQKKVAHICPVLKRYAESVLPRSLGAAGLKQHAGISILERAKVAFLRLAAPVLTPRCCGGYHLPLVSAEHALITVLVSFHPYTY